MVKKIFENTNILLVVTILLIVVLSLLGPEEKDLGRNVKLVYLHGAWVLAAELAFILAGVVAVGALIAPYTGLLSKAADLHAWSQALGITGLIYWISYLPLSMLAMQSNWNGLFLAEPRFRLALTFAVVGLLLQAGLWIMNHSVLAALGNIAYIVFLRVLFANAANVMHPPPSPIFNSGNYVLIFYFVSLILLTFFSAILVASISYRKIAAR